MYSPHTRPLIELSIDLHLFIKRAGSDALNWSDSRIGNFNYDDNRSSLPLPLSLSHSAFRKRVTYLRVYSEWTRAFAQLDISIILMSCRNLDESSVRVLPSQR